MKLLTAQQIKDWDSFTILHEPISSIDLMERAAMKCAVEIENMLHPYTKYSSVLVFCGPGNNGGDGLVIARALYEKGIRVDVLLFSSGMQTTGDFEVNRKRLPDAISVVEVLSEKDIPNITIQQVVVDALFGNGLSRAPEGLQATAIDRINASEAFVVAIDIPSGLPAQVNDIEEIQNRSIIKADITLTFQLPKKSFLHAECSECTGIIKVLDIGLHPAFLNQVASDDFYITSESIQSIIRPRPSFSHKGTFGHVLMAAGSYGKLGAAMLASRAALRTGCGLLSVFIPKVGYTVMQTALPEAMVLTDDEVFELRNFPSAQNFSAVGIGPGIGTNEYTVKGMLTFLKNVHQPIVMDADALNGIATEINNRTDFSFPRHCIITPHPKEFDRLAGPSHTSFERIQKQRVFAQHYGIVVLLKGAHTSIATPDGRTYYNSSGNPLLATAGSGDVLTGMIASLLAQQYSVEDAAVLGVYLHGLCADLWKQQGNETMIASDIVDKIPQALYNLKCNL